MADEIKELSNLSREEQEFILENFDWLNFAEVLEKSFKRKSSIVKISSHAILKTELDSNIFREWIKTNFSEVKIMSVGNALEIYKEIFSRRDFKFICFKLTFDPIFENLSLISANLAKSFFIDNKILFLFFTSILFFNNSTQPNNDDIGVPS